MADAKLTALSEFTPVSTDLLYGVDDPGGTPISGKILISALATLLWASPTLVTPTLGEAAATSINKVAITAPATAATLTIADGVTLTVNASVTIAAQPPILGANTFTALQTITQASANAGIIASTGYSLTGSNATSMINLAGTWNTTGTPSAIKLDITDTLSNAASLLLDLRVGGNTYFSVRKDGAFSARMNAAGTSAVSLTAGNTPTFDVQQSTGLKSQLTPLKLAIFNGASATSPAIIRSGAAAKIVLGDADAAAPVAQTFSVQGVVAGTTNTAGAAWTIGGSISTGTGIGGSIVFATSTAGTTGTVQNAHANALELTGNKNVVIGNAALATDAVDGFLYIPSCAGTPTGTPTAYTGRVPLVWDSANDKLYVFDTSWKGGTVPGAFI